MDTVMSNRKKHRPLEVSVYEVAHLQDYHEEILCEGGEYFAKILQDIKQAHSTIDIETYIFNKDHLAKRITDALVAASQRGVAVRMMIDGAGAPLWGGHLIRSMEKSGIETKIFHPFPWQVWHWGRSVVKLPWAVKWIYLLYKMNSRNHRKTCVIDHNIAYIGSININKCHLGRDEGGDDWRDTAVRVSGMPMDSLQAAFNHAWTGRKFSERIRDVFKRVRQNPVFRFNNTWHRRRILHKQLLKRIMHARTRIWITNAYFIPDNFLLKRLRDAADSGVDVRILLPKKSDVFFMPWASVIFYRNLLKAGVRIFEYNLNMLHSKTLIIDDWMLVGSSNLNHRSLLHDLEVDVHLRTKGAQLALVEQFKLDLEHAHEVPATNWKSRPWYQRWLGRMVLYMKYWI